jgi:RNA-directed DNA polymerase
VKLPGATHPILGFQYQTDADRFLENLRERLAKFGLELHPDKTRRIEFGRFAEENRKRRGEGKPETFDFLGFTHISGKNSLGRFLVRRKTIRKRIRGKLRKVKQQLRRRMHDPLPQTGRWLRSVVQGHFNYYAVPGNLASLGAFRDRVLALWWLTLRAGARDTGCHGRAFLPWPCAGFLSRARFILFRMHASPPLI